MSGLRRNPWVEYLREVVTRSHSEHDASDSDGSTSSSASVSSRRQIPKRHTEGELKEVREETTNRIDQLQQELDQARKDIKTLEQSLRRDQELKEEAISEIRKFMTMIWDHTKEMTQWAAMVAKEKSNKQ